ncbi:MAG: type 1 glutamine amidotransferase family protein [Methanoregula sp.]|nr:type 1 glutamine amidotransferase family protein [Methanoregula sp.]
MEKIVYLFTGDGFADFEPAIAIDIISKTNATTPKLCSYEIRTFGKDKTPVKSLGGLTILPDSDMSGVEISKAAMVIFPGTMEIMNTDIPGLANLVFECRKKNVPIAGICGATVFLAKLGLLDTVRHTSNGPEWLKKMAPEYRGENYYLHEPAVSDQGIITANPCGNVEFAGQIFRTLGLLPPEVLDFFLMAQKKGYMNFDLIPEPPEDSK